MEIILKEVEAMKGFNQMNPNHIYDLYEHTIKVVEAVEAENDTELKIAALLHDIGKLSCFTQENGVRKFIGHAKVSAEKAEKILQEAGYPEDVINRISWLVAEHETDLSSKKSMKKRLEAAGETQVRKLLKLRRADIMAQAPSVQEEHLEKLQEAEQTLEELLKEASSPTLTIKDLAITAKDLMELGFKGPQIGEAQRKALALVNEGKVKNEKQSILDSLK